MNLHYWNRYLKFIEWCDAQDLPESEYTEKHHIIPRCYGGDDSNDNLIRLPYQAHILAHWMLAKATKDKNMISAFVFISKGGKYSFKTSETIRVISYKLLSASTKEYYSIEANRKKLGELTKIGLNKPETRKKHLAALKKKMLDNPEAHELQYRNMMKSREADPTFHLRRQIGMIKSRLKKGYHTGGKGTSFKKANTHEQILEMINKIKLLQETIKCYTVN